jgi:hypothetical protein
MLLSCVKPAIDPSPLGGAAHQIGWTGLVANVLPPRQPTETGWLVGGPAQAVQDALDGRRVCLTIWMIRPHFSKPGEGGGYFEGQRIIRGDIGRP